MNLEAAMFEVSQFYLAMAIMFIVIRLLEKLSYRVWAKLTGAIEL